MTKKFAFLGASAMLAFAAAAVLASRSGHASDHFDSPSLAGSPLADINDVYAWMTSDGAKVNIAMTVSPGDPGNRPFDPTVQYVFHVHSKPMSGIGQASTTETQVICTFASNTSVQCWVKAPSGVKDYASGDPSAIAGIASRLGTFKVFAGRRSDPFFFNLQGFRDAVAAVKARAAAGPPDTISFDATGKCPNNLSDADVGGLRVLLVAQRPTNILEVPNCPSTEKDCFKAFRTLAIVVQIDKTLLNAPNNNVIGVWASTHMGP